MQGGAFWYNHDTIFHCPVALVDIGILREGFNNHTLTDAGVFVRRVVEESIAASAGLLVGDIIVMAAGQKIKDNAQLVTIIQAMAPGTWLPLSIQRGETQVDIVAHFPAAGRHQDASEP